MVSRRAVFRSMAIAAGAAALPGRLGAETSQAGSAGAMTDGNVRLVRLQHDLIAAGRLEEAAGQFSDPVRNHGRPVPRRLLLAILEDNKRTFPDWSMPIEEIAASGPNVVVRCRFRGTHQGTGKLPINGGLMLDVPPTRRKVDVQHIHWYAFDRGLIVEHRAGRDDVAMMQQLGLLPEVPFDWSKLLGPGPGSG